MTVILHTVIVASNLVVASSIALLLPQLVAWLTPQQAPLVGAVLFLLGTLCHVIFVGTEARRVLRTEIRDLKRAHKHLEMDLSAVRGLSNDLRRGLEGADQVSQERVDGVVAEVKVLQGLIERFYRGRQQIELPGPTADAPPTAAPDPVPADGSLLQGAAEPERPPMPPVARELGQDQVREILLEGLRLDRVDVYLQPVVSLPQRRTKFYECFTRIRDDQGRMVVPEQYIPIAEREGLVAAIDNMLLFRCVQLIRRTERRKVDTILFCNVSHESIADTEFFGDFIDFVVENQDLAPKLVLELPQADVADADTTLGLNLRRLARLGFGFSLDQVSDLDFDFDALASGRFRFVKLSAARVIDEIEGGHTDFRELKRNLELNGIDLIVEKIESEDQLLQFLDFNIDFGQGFLFSEPRLTRDS